MVEREGTRVRYHCREPDKRDRQKDRLRQGEIS